MLHIAESSAENNKIKDTGVDFISALLLPSKQFDSGTFGCGDMLGVERFGASAPAAVVLREYGFTVDNVCARAKALLVLEQKQSQD